MEPGATLDRGPGVGGLSSPTPTSRQILPRHSQEKPGQQGDDEGKGRGVTLPLAPDRAAREAALRPPLAPLPRAGFAVAGFLEGEVKRMANPPSARPPRRENHQMQAEDAELEQFRRGVSCAALLEGWAPSWRLDRKESTRRALKYRHEEDEVLIVNHDGRGWWDPQSAAKGDIFDLVQYLDPHSTSAGAPGTETVRRRRAHLSAGRERRREK